MNLAPTEGMNLCRRIPAFMALRFYLEFGRRNKILSLALAADKRALNCRLWGALSVRLPPRPINGRS